MCIFIFRLIREKQTGSLFPAQPQPNFLYESGEIASEKALAMTATMHFDGTLHVVIASETKQSFTHKKRYLLKEVCEKTYKKRSSYTVIL
ncbi:MAG: hypothetical protein DYG84_11580 [Candidatus Brocadia sp. AMX3]|nr:hypothetical protein [Candidatus Brocadia sp. AMX3]